MVQDNYKTLTASALADGHGIIAQSPIDINIAKQLNILISDMAMPLDRIVINPTVGALGYGLEYAYSIMERAAWRRYPVIRCWLCLLSVL